MDKHESAAPMGTPLQRVESYQYPNTHVGHLSQGQTGALEKFRALCQQKGYYRPAGPGGEPSHDDETLLRYLRARKFIPQDAFQQFKDTEDWRKNNRIDELYETIDITEYDETRRLYPQWTGRRDMRGIPLYVFEVAHLTSKRMSAYEKSISSSKSFGSVPPKLMRLFALYENLLRFTMPLCSGVPDRPYAETPVSQSNNIVDISGVGLKQFWNLKQHMQDASTLATAHYPETLDRIFIIGAPSFFPTVWGWIKRWFDPITVSKIFILSQNDMRSTLEKYIEPANIPKKYGGKLDWEWGSLPNIEPSISNVLNWEHASKDEKGRDAFPPGPVRWEKNSKGDLVAIAVGSAKGRRRHETVATLPLREQVNVGAVTAAAADLGAPLEQVSTTGYHTHPTEGQEFFPTSGNTPPNESEESRSRSGSVDPTFSLPTRNSISGRPAVADGSATAPNSHPREGTSTTRYWQQDPTHAKGEMAQGTPYTIDHGYGDKTSTMEPSTVGQAPKNVDVPNAQAAQSASDSSYLGQAKAVATSAYSNTAAVIGSAESTVLAAVGYGANGKEQNGKPEERPAQKQKFEDPRVDRMQNKDVEDFLRSKYTTHNELGTTHKAGG